MTEQLTLKNPVKFAGIGLHSGCQVQMRILPAPADSGCVFRRTDLDDFPVEVNAAHIANVSYATTLMKKGVIISTVEHVLSALYGLGVDNAIIEVSDLEVPIMDGSAGPFVEGILDAGLVGQNIPRRCLRVTRSLAHELGDKMIAVEPADELFVHYVIDFDHPLIGEQVGAYRIEPETYRHQLAPCRTFGFMKDIEFLKENGLIKGGSLENAVVLTDDGLMNPDGLRFPDEFVRHKVMDFLGDISLLGMPVLGRFSARKAGHGVHASLVKKILSDTDNFEVIAAPCHSSRIAV
ncbi:MAG: UDP-3-O-acyl-N-acetylglucosamine deacetylase [Acidobacteria bacterium]|nr:UDP-3-O-acyl-N-acetylglucosamine deacetylase [Acidobacteriota bacterium]